MLSKIEYAVDKAYCFFKVEFFFSGDGFIKDFPNLFPNSIFEFYVKLYLFIVITFH